MICRRQKMIFAFILFFLGLTSCFFHKQYSSINGKYENRVHNTIHTITLNNDSTFTYYANAGLTKDSSKGVWYFLCDNYIVLHSNLQDMHVDRNCLINKNIIEPDIGRIKVIDASSLKEIPFEIYCFQDGKIDTVMESSKTGYFDYDSNLNCDTVMLYYDGYERCYLSGKLETHYERNIKLIPSRYFVLDTEIYKVKGDSLIDQDGYIFNKK